MISLLNKHCADLFEILSWGNIQDTNESLKNFVSFLDHKKISLYAILEKFPETEDFELSDFKSSKEKFETWLTLFQWKFEDIFLYQAEDLAEIYENIYFINKAFEKLKTNNNYNILWEILFELYEHLLPHHMIPYLEKTLKK